jgi:hypothetical protein
MRARGATCWRGTRDHFYSLLAGGVTAGSVERNIEIRTRPDRGEVIWRQVTRVSGVIAMWPVARVSENRHVASVIAHGSLSLSLSLPRSFSPIERRSIQQAKSPGSRCSRRLTSPPPPPPQFYLVDRVNESREQHRRVPPGLQPGSV